MTRQSIIGQPLPRHDALGKVSGAAAYPADKIDPATLHLAVVFSAHAHARILGVTTDAARAMPGVVAVLTAADVPYNAFGLIDHDQPVLCSDTVRFLGDKVVLVVATSREAAHAAAEHVEVAYEPLPGVFDPSPRTTKPMEKRHSKALAVAGVRSTPALRKHFHPARGRFGLPRRNCPKPMDMF